MARKFTKYPQTVQATQDIPKDYAYDCENSKFTVYRNKYTGDEIHVPKEKQVTASEVSSDECKELAVDIFLKYKKGMNFIDIAQELGLSLNDTKKLYNSIGAGCNIQFIAYPNDTTNGAIGRTGTIYKSGEDF